MVKCGLAVLHNYDFFRGTSHIFDTFSANNVGFYLSLFLSASYNSVTAFVDRTKNAVQLATEGSVYTS